MADLAWAQSSRNRLRPVWQTFWDNRRRYDLMIQRKSPVDLPPHLAPYGKGAIDIQSPDLEEALSTRVQIKMIRPTKIDAVALDSGEKAKKDVEANRIWYGYQWRRVNRNRRLDRARAEAQDRYGVFVERMYWKMPTEAESDTEDRLENYRAQSDDCFDIRSVNPLTCAWLPLAEPTLFIEESIVPYYEASNLQNAAGDFLRLDDAGKVFFLADPEPIVLAPQSAGYSKKLHVLTIAWKEPKSGNWKIAEHVFPEGSNMADSGETLSEVDVPFNRCPYFVGLGGSNKIFETDPDLCFRPSMYPLLVDVIEENGWRNMIAALAIKHSTEVTVNLSSLKADQMSFLEELFPVEGQGANRRMVFRLPDPGSNEIAALPQVEKWPAQLDQALITLLQQTQENKKRHMPNRFQTGDISRTEVAEGKATTMVNAQEASSLPYSADLQLQDPVTVEELEAIGEMIQFWDKGVESDSQKLYPAITNGDEPLMRGGPEVGTEVVVSAATLSRKHQIYVLTRNQTQAEEEREALMAYQDYTQGVISFDQLLVKRGEDDPGRQNEELEKDRLRKLNQPGADQLKLQAITTLWTAMSGINIAALKGSPVPMPPGASVSAPAEQVQLAPPRHPGGAPVDRAPPPPPRIQVAPAVAPSAIAGPQGGSSPTR